MRRPAAIFLIAAAILVCGVLGSALAPSTNRLPGIDSGNLYAWEVYTRTVLAEGRLPFWNPYHFAGTPHLSDPQTTVLYPPALLLRWLPVPAFLGWMMGLHLLIAAAGALFAARVLRLGWLPASATAVAVMLGGSVPGWIHNGHLLLLYSVAWVPWAFALAVLSVRSGRWLPDGRLVAVLVLQFLSGYLQGSLYLAIAVAGYFVFSTVWRDESAAPAPRWQPLVQLALLGVLCGGGVAFQLLPTATLVSQAGRSAGLTYENALEGGWTLRDLATTYFPFYGAAQTPVYRYLSDRLVYVGWTLTAFAPFAFVLRDRWRIAVFLGLLVVVAFAVALGDTLGVYRLHHALLPGLRVPGRVLFLATFALAMLGGLGVDAFVTVATRREWRRLAVPAVLTIGAVAAAVYTGGGTAQSPAALPLPGWPSWQATLAVGTLMVAAAGLAGWRRTALTLALFAVVADITALNARAMDTVPIESASEIRASIGASPGGRSISLCENRISARELLLNREPTLDGLPGLHLRDYGDWAFVARTGEVPAGDGLYRRIGSEGAPPARGDLIDLANVTRVVSCDSRADGGLVITANDRAWPRAVWVCGADEVSRRQGINRLVQGRYDRTHELRPRRYIRVKWAADVGDARRTEREAAHALEDGVPIEDGAWRYALGDASPAAVVAIMVDPDVHDTHGVDRRTGVITAVPGDGASGEAPVADEHRYVLVGARPCANQAQVATVAADRTDGLVAARVNAPSDGVVFFSEPFYSERKAYVDGRRVDAYRADLAFTAVPVPAGYHRVELRYTPTSFYLGSLVSGVTGAAYLGVGLRRRQRRR